MEVSIDQSPDLGEGTAHVQQHAGDGEDGDEAKDNGREGGEQVEHGVPFAV
jgi:hypothetical protein